jgi:hypothetical protein
MDNFNLKKYLAESKLLKEEEVDVLGNEFLQDIQDTMKMYYKMDVDMDDIKDWVNMYYIGYNSEYDEGPGDVDYEGNEFGSEDYESEKKELVFDTAEREDFYMHLNPEADSTFPNLAEGKQLNENAPGYDTRKFGEALPTLESVKAAYDEKDDMHDDPGDIRIDHDYYTENLKEERFDGEREMMMHIKQYRDGMIDGDDLVQAFEEIINGKVTPPGYNTRYGR